MIDGYDLERDVAAIDRALEQDMPEAAVFYSGRALEATAARAVAALGLEPGSQVYANLDTLERLSCIPRPALQLGHALRRLSNDARHILRPLSKPDADFAALCLGPWLQWYLEDYFLGPRTAAPAVASPLAAGTADEILALLSRAHASGEDVAERLLPLCDAGLARLPALSSMVAETLISCGHGEAAQRVLAAALAAVPGDLRLNQLYALGRRRAGHPDEALARLKTLSARYGEDEETLGITAGALKSAEDLPQALRLYAKGWQVSRERNLYLGLNAATLQFWLGDAPRARALARRIVEAFALRSGQLAKAGIAVRRDYYDLVTEAEARLIAGEPAHALYEEAFTTYAARKSDIEGSKAQANRSIALLGGDAIV